MESKKNYGQLSKVYRAVLIYILAVALVSFVYKQSVLNEDALSSLIPEIFMITMSFIILIIGLIKNLDGPGHLEEMNKSKYHIHLIGLMLVIIVGLGLHFYYKNMLTQMGEIPYPYMAPGLMSIGFLVYGLSMKKLGLSFNQSILSKSKKDYIHEVLKVVGYIFIFEFVYIMLVVFSGAMMNYTRQGVNRMILSIFIVGLIFMIHYLICSFYSKLSFDEQKDEEKNKEKPIISKKIVLLFGVSVTYRVLFAVSNLLVLKMQDYLNIPYNRLLDLMHVYLWTQYFEISYWILMGVIGYLFYKALIQNVSNEKLRLALKLLMVAFPVYVISQSFMNVFGSEIESMTGILRYQQLSLSVNIFTQSLIAVSFVSGLFICYVMRQNQIPACLLFLAHVLIAFLGKTAIYTFQLVGAESNFAYASGLVDFGFVVLTSTIMLYYLIKLNNQNQSQKKGFV
jgi:hypothetical protein